MVFYGLYLTYFILLVYHYVNLYRITLPLFLHFTMKKLQLGSPQIRFPMFHEVYIS